MSSTEPLIAAVPPAQPGRPARFRTWRSVLALFIREMSTTYGRNAAGYLWAILEPVAGIALLSIIFSITLRSPSLGTNFQMFYASGMLPFSAYMVVSSKLSTAVRFSKQLLTYPGVTYIDALLARFLLNALTQILVFMILIAGIMYAYDLKLIIDIPQIALGFAMTFWLAAGIGTLNCYLLSTYPSWERTWAILNRPMFIISCIFFLFEDVPQPYQDWLWWNPLIHIVGQVRGGIYATYDNGYVSPGYVFAVGGVTLALGLLFLRRYHRDIMND